jgi:nucleoside-diphosphate-sugar epimerase
MELVRVRPPLVYGPGVKGNFRVLLDGVRRRVPLPLACVSNARSLVGIDNLVDMLLRCIDHPRASGRAFFASDGEDVSTPELIRRLSAAMGRSNPLLWPVPEAMLRAGMLLAGREATFDRVCGTLQIDISAARGALGWQPPVSMDEGLKRMVARS